MRELSGHGCRRWLLLLALAIDAFPNGSDVAQADRRTIQITKTDLLAGETQHGKFAYFFASAISGDGCHAAKVEGRQGQEVFVRRDGRRGKAYTDISQPVFSPNGNALAYAARDSRGARIVINDDEGPAVRAVLPETFVFSRDGRRHAYLATTDAGPIIVVDRRLQPAVGDGMTPRLQPPVFSEDGSSVGYLAGSRAKKKMRAVINSVPGESYDGIDLESLLFSADGKRSAYAANVRGDGGGWCVVLDGEQGPWFEGLGVSFVFSPDGRRFAYAGRKENQWYLVEAGISATPIEGIVDHTLAFSPDSRRVAYAVARPDRRCYVVVDGEPGPLCDRIGVSTSGALSLHREFATGGMSPRRAPTGIVFSPDCRHVAYAAQSGSSWKVYRDGDAEDVEMDALVGWLQFSADSSRLAYGGRSRRVTSAGSAQRTFLVVDGVPGADCDALGRHAFSPDGTHVAYAALKGEQSVVVIDQTEIGEYDAVAAGPAFRTDGILEFLVAEERSLYRIEAVGF